MKALTKAIIAAVRAQGCHPVVEGEGARIPPTDMMMDVVRLRNTTSVHQRIGEVGEARFGEGEEVTKGSGSGLGLLALGYHFVAVTFGDEHARRILAFDADGYDFERRYDVEAVFRGVLQSLIAEEWEEDLHVA